MSQENVTDERVLYAADNNARWCDMVCRSHGIPTAMQDGLWVALGRSPDLYPDAVTLLPGIAAEDVLGAVQAGPGCSVKDSFAALDLTQMGFAELFRAQWIFREPGPLPQSRAQDWTVVETDEGLDNGPVQRTALPRRPRLGEVGWARKSSGKTHLGQVKRPAKLTFRTARPRLHRSEHVLSGGAGKESSANPDTGPAYVPTPPTASPAWAVGMPCEPQTMSHQRALLSAA